MRHALVVYESMFGNTHQVAAAIADGLRESFDKVTMTEVSEAPKDVAADVELLVIGGPTHALGMSRPRTRQSAGQQGADATAAGHEGIREWISRVSAPEGTLTATFDTKVVKPHLPGSAASSAQRKLRHRGLRVATHPETFYVTGTEGGLVEGEFDRARAWGAELAHTLPAC